MNPAMDRFKKASYYLRLARTRHRDGGISVARQTGELLYLRLFNGIRTAEYFAAGLERPGISFRDKREFVLRGPFLRLLYRANREQYKFVMMHKVATYGILGSFGVPTPRFLGVAGAMGGRTYDGAPLREPADLARLLDRTGVDEVCFKPVGNWGGEDFARVNVDRQGGSVALVAHPDGQRSTIEEFWHSGLTGHEGSGYICQAVIRQREELARLHPWSVNTARVWTYQKEMGKWEVFAALLRMGVGKAVVDNTSAGGITARIDVRTGELSAAIDEEPERGMFRKHPTTGAPIEGVVLPIWEDVLDLAVRASEVFPYFRLLALDIAFGRDGPVVIEMECEPGAGHQITFGRGVKSLLVDLAKRGSLDWRE
jgi:hypothetical protein